MGADCRVPPTGRIPVSYAIRLDKEESEDTIDEKGGDTPEGKGKIFANLFLGKLTLSVLAQGISEGG